MRLSGIYAKIVVKDRNKSIDRYYLRKALERRGRADIKDPNGDNYSTKESAATRPKYCIEKKLIKISKSFNEKPDMAKLGNIEKQVSNISKAIFHPTFDRFWTYSNSISN